MPAKWSPRAMFGAVGEVARQWREGPWLTFGRTSSGVTLYEVGGRTYVMDIIVPTRPGQWRGWGKSWASDARALGRGKLTVGGTDTEVILTEVADPTVKHQVVIAYAAQKPKVIALGEARHWEPTSLLVILRLAQDDTPEGLAAAVPHVAVFEVTPLAV